MHSKAHYRVMDEWILGEFKWLELNCLCSTYENKLNRLVSRQTRSLVFGSPVQNIEISVFYWWCLMFPSIERGGFLHLYFAGCTWLCWTILNDTYRYAAWWARCCQLLLLQPHHWFVSPLRFALLCDMWGKSFSCSSCMVMFALDQVSGRISILIP